MISISLSFRKCHKENSPAPRDAYALSLHERAAPVLHGFHLCLPVAPIFELQLQRVDEPKNPSILHRNCLGFKESSGRIEATMTDEVEVFEQV